MTSTRRIANTNNIKLRRRTCCATGANPSCNTAHTAVWRPHTDGCQESGTVALPDESRPVSTTPEHTANPLRSQPGTRVEAGHVCRFGEHRVDVVEAVNTIVLNAADLEITAVRVKPTGTTFSLDEATERLVIEADLDIRACDNGDRFAGTSTTSCAVSIAARNRR